MPTSVFAVTASVSPSIESERPNKRGVRTVSKSFTDKSYALFVQAYAKTCNFRRAAKSIGFCHETVYQYLRKQPERFEALKRDIEAPVFFKIEELGNEEKDWRAFAWLLERTNPEKYALTEVHRVENSGQVEHMVHMVPIAELEADISRIREIQAQVLS